MGRACLCGLGRESGCRVDVHIGAGASIPHSLASRAPELPRHHTGLGVDLPPAPVYLPYPPQRIVCVVLRAEGAVGAGSDGVPEAA